MVNGNFSWLNTTHLHYIATLKFEIITYCEEKTQTYHHRVQEFPTQCPSIT